MKNYSINPEELEVVLLVDVDASKSPEEQFMSLVTGVGKLRDPDDLMNPDAVGGGGAQRDSNASNVSGASGASGTTNDNVVTWCLLREIDPTKTDPDLEGVAKANKKYWWKKEALQNMGFASKLEKRKSLQQMQESYLNQRDMELNSIKRYYEDRGKFLANLKDDFEKYRKKAEHVTKLQ